MKMKHAATRQLEIAETSAALARADVMATLLQIRHRIDPRVIVAETAERGLAHVTGLLDGAKVSMRRRPWLVAAGATLVGIALAARVRLLAEKSESDETDLQTDG